MPNPVPAVIYARFSPRPDAADCDSIAKQLERTRAYCTAQGYEVAAEYDDAEASGGRADNRPGLQRALAHACRSRAVLVCYDLSRLARSTRDAIAIADRLQAAGANLAFLDMKLDTTSPTGRCFFTILAAFAQLYREQISARTSAAMLKHQASGRRMGGHLPYGMKASAQDPTMLEADEDEARVIAQIVGLRDEGFGARKIAERLNEAGTPARGARWHVRTVQRILER